VLLLHGSLEMRLTDGWPAYEAALKTNHVTYTLAEMTLVPAVAARLSREGAFTNKID
jgi:hypothetical protein